MISALVTVACTVTMCGCTIDINAEDISKLYTMFNNVAEQRDDETGKIGYRFLDAEEGSRLLLSNGHYYDKLTTENLRYRMRDKDAKLEKYREFAGSQVLDYTQEEKEAIADAIDFVESRFDEIGFEWPIEEDILFVRTTMKEEPGQADIRIRTRFIWAGQYLIMLSV